MKLSDFIKRPILSCVISVLIVLLGGLSIFTLPIEQYPDIAPPTVEVSTYFYGADAQTIIKSVITPLEEAINGVENMLYMQSSASNAGEITVSVVFKQGTNPDIAAVKVQNRVSKATSQLPSDVTKYGVTVEKKQNSMLQIFSVTSPDDTYDYQFLSNYASINIKPRIMLISGIGEFKMMGTDYSMRLWLDPTAMMQHNLTPDEITNALSTQNIEAATGTIGENSDETYQYTMKYTGRLKSVEEFENVVIRADESGNILRLKDIAKIELGCENYMFTGQANGHPGVLCIAYQSAGSNATQVNTEISALLDQIREEAPSGLEIMPLMNTNDFLFASIEQVLETLRDAIILVILIVLLFLKDFRSTIIPFISIMVSLIGTFAFMSAAGFSINLLTLFALVLVIGTVVDDSIVVVEAVHAKFEAGILNSSKATKEAIGEIAAAVLTSSLVFMAVFIPVSMMSGTSGVFYRQFGLTMAVAVGISALNALTTVPALCALMLKPIEKPEEGKKKTFKQRYAEKFDAFFDKFSNAYGNGLKKAIHAKPVFWILVAAGTFVTIWCMTNMPSGLVPNEDTGILIMEVNLPAGTSLHATDRTATRIGDDIRALKGVENVAVSGGYGFIAGTNSSAATIIVKLEHWEKRDKHTNLENMKKALAAVGAKYKEASCIVFSTPMIPGYGTNNGIDMYIQDRTGGSTQEFYDISKEFLQKLTADGIYGFMTFNMDFPQWEVSVNVPKCIRYGISPKDALATLAAYYGGTYINDINLYSKIYKVKMQADPNARRDEQSLNFIYLRTGKGEMAPLSNFVSLKRIYGPDAMKTFNKFTAINVSAASELSAGETLEVLNKRAKEYLPQGYTIDFAGMTREQNNQGGLGSMLILSIFVIYLILAALYESLVIPVAAIFAIPVGLAGSYGISLLVGLDNNIYLQTGVIMLIGLLAKTAILITEYAVDRHKEGMSIEDAAIAAAKARLRPICMTVCCMAIGLLPLVLSINGVGGKGNFSLGLGTIVGLVIGTVALLYITPVMYTTFQSIHDKMNKGKKDEDDEE